MRQQEDRGTVNPFRPNLPLLWFFLWFLSWPGLPALEAQPEPSTPRSGTRVRPSEAVARSASRMTELRNLLAEIRRERRAAEDARQAWQRDRASLEDEIEALDQANARLTVQLEERTRQAGEARTRRDEAAAELDRLRTHAEAGLRLEYGRTLRWLLRHTEHALPVDRAARVDAVKRAIRRAERENTELSRLAGDTFGFVFKALTRSRTIEAHRTVLGESDGNQRVVDALRIGPVQALSLTPDDREIRSILLAPDRPPAWSEPVEDPGLSRALRRAIEIARRRRTPELIELPIPAGSATTGEDRP